MTDSPTIVVEVPDTPAAGGNSVTVPLSGGRTAVLRPPKGRDMLGALKLAKGESAPEIMFGILTKIALIDGKPVRYEDILEMDLSDCLELQNAIAKNFLKGSSLS